MFTRIRAGIEYRVHLGLKAARRGAIKAMRSAPFDSTHFGPVRGFVRTAREWAREHQHTTDLLRVLEPDADFRRTPPKTIDGSFPWQFERFYEGVNGKALPGTVLEVPGGRVFGTGTIIDERDRMIGDVSREMFPGNDQSLHSIYRRMSLPTVNDVKGTVGVVARHTRLRSIGIGWWICCHVSICSVVMSKTSVL